MDGTVQKPEETAEGQRRRLRVICGANVEELEDCYGITPPEVAHRLKGIMNISSEHSVVLINGSVLQRPGEYLLKGTEELEFKRPAGQKG